MKSNRTYSAAKWITLVLVTSLFACMVSGCDIVELLTKGTDIIDHFANASTDASTPENAAGISGGFPDLSGLFTNPTAPGQTAPMATAPAATEPTAPEYVFDPVDMCYGIVLSDSVTLYEQPSQNASHCGSLTYGDRILVYGEDKGWVFTISGWAKAENFYLEGDTGEYAVGSSTVTGTDVNLRTGPGMDYEVIKRHNTGDQLNILEEFLFESLWWGYTGEGWICMDYIYVNGTMSENYGIGIITGDVVNVRKGPGTNYETVGSVKQGQQVEVFNFFTVKNVKWACTSKGWICMDFMRYTPA